MTHTLSSLPLPRRAKSLVSTLTWLPLLLLFLLTQGCALFQPSGTGTPPPPDTQVDWLEHVEKLTLLKEWQIKGKIGVRTKDDGGSAYVDWSQSHDSFYIILNGPLGQGTTIVSGNPSGARLEQSDGTYVAESPDQLVQEHTGWEIPINDLLYWIKGLPAPTGQPQLTHNALGTLATLEQDGWSLEFDQYVMNLGTLLPQRIRIRKGELRVVLVVKDWLPLEAGGKT
ncbi:MAG TPA: lipoprotein insertase outer membrane protein LolB [Dongiaceae bacterium]|nr:lipoprotein insertase outer membrane protein LolB [Dongiaceae bacterium]